MGLLWCRILALGDHAAMKAECVKIKKERAGNSQSVSGPSELNDNGDDRTQMPKETECEVTKKKKANSDSQDSNNNTSKRQKTKAADKAQGEVTTKKKRVTKKRITDSCEPSTLPLPVIPADFQHALPEVLADLTRDRGCAPKAPPTNKPSSITPVTSAHTLPITTSETAAVAAPLNKPTCPLPPMTSQSHALTSETTAKSPPPVIVPTPFLQPVATTPCTQSSSTPVAMSPPIHAIPAATSTFHTACTTTPASIPSVTRPPVPTTQSQSENTPSPLSPTNPHSCTPPTPVNTTITPSATTPTYTALTTVTGTHSPTPPIRPNPEYSAFTTTSMNTSRPAYLPPSTTSAFSYYQNMLNNDNHSHSQSLSYKPNVFPLHSTYTMLYNTHDTDMNTTYTDMTDSDTMTTGHDASAPIPPSPSPQLLQDILKRVATLEAEVAELKARGNTCNCEGVSGAHSGSDNQPHVFNGKHKSHTKQDLLHLVENLARPLDAIKRLAEDLFTEEEVLNSSLKGVDTKKKGTGGLPRDKLDVIDAIMSEKYGLSTGEIDKKMRSRLKILKKTYKGLASQ